MKFIASSGGKVKNTCNNSAANSDQSLMWSQCDITQTLAKSNLG